MGARIVVIGGVAAGMSAASKAKRVDPEAEVIVYTQESFISYSACSLPYLAKNLISDVNELVARTPEQMMAQGVMVYTRHEVTAIHPEKKTIEVTDENGKKLSVSYDKLVIATGSKNIVPALENIDASGVFTVKNIPDIQRLQGYIGEHDCKTAVIIGGGFIGIEMADALNNIGLSITLVEKEAQLLSILDKHMAEYIRAYMEKQGIRICCETAAKGLCTDAAGYVRAVRTNNGELPADIVIMAIGLVPNTALAEKAGLKLGPRRAILVDEQMRTSVQDIYAAGDCASTKLLVTGEDVSICLGTIANRNGKVAGENVAGGRAVYTGELGTCVFKIFDMEAGKTGLSLREAQIRGIDAFENTIQSNTRASGYPGRGPIYVELVVEKGTNRLLGGQIFGAEGSAKRIDVIAAYVQLRQSVESLAILDMAYAPPFSPVWDPILVAAGQAAAKAKKMALQ